MYILSPLFDHRIWGGCFLTNVYGKDAERLAHLYSVVGKKDYSNQILGGVYSGESLKNLFEIKKNEWGMEKFNDFPITIALVDAADDLSIQVHPNDTTAYNIEGLYGKREAWYFLRKPECGYIYNGCKSKDIVTIKNKTELGKIIDVADKLEIDNGSYVYIEPGTVHAMTAGSIVYEIEEGSDLTYRLYDYDRIDLKGQKRKLHIEKGLASLDTAIKSKVKRYSGNEWQDEPTFSTCLLSDICGYKNDSRTIECVTLLQGNLKIYDINILLGMSILLEPKEIINLPIERCIVARVNVLYN